MKVIFLDIDGVVSTKRVGFMGLDNKCTRRLQQIVYKTNAKIVISSSWRIDHTLEEFQQLFREYNIPKEWIIGATPDLKRAHRGDEISEWLKTRSNIEKYIILDDDSDMTCHMEKLILTDTHKGLLEEHAKKAIDMLS